MSNDAAVMRQQIDYLQRQIQALQSPISETECDALTKAQHRADSVAAMFGTKVSAPIPGESSVSYRKRIAASLQKYSPQLKNARLDMADLPTLDVLEEQIYNDAVSAARNGEVPTGQLREVSERDASGRLVTRFYGDIGSWMAPFMSGGRVTKVRRPEGDRS